MSGPADFRHIALVPRDGLFCKDGRGWHTSASGRGHALDWPWPSTILGAMRTAWGRNQERSGSLFDANAWREKTADIQLGRTLVLRRQRKCGSSCARSTGSRIWPVPTDALWVEAKQEVYRLKPRKPDLPTLGRECLGIEEAREALWAPHVLDRSKAKSPPRWWSEANLVAWLSGGSVKAASENEPGAGTFMLQRRVQAHVGIEAARLTADEGVLFAHDIVETLERTAEWEIVAEILLPSGETPSIATLGADGRLAHIEGVDSGLFEPPQTLLKAFEAQQHSGVRLMVVTPTEFEQGWLPFDLKTVEEKFEGELPGLGIPVVLRAAFVGRPVHVSGWDMAASRPKPTSRMVPPGSVYFLERSDGKVFDDRDACALWMTAFGKRTTEGFGRVVPGIWDPNES